MKNSKVKSFTFQVAKKNDAKKDQWKAREGVAMAGCTMVSYPWGQEPMCNFGSHGGGGGDGSVWC